MTLKSTRFEVWDDLYERWGLEPGTAEAGADPSVSPVIVPVTNIDDAVRQAQLFSSTDDLSGGSAAAVAVVPDDEIWTLWKLRRSGTVAASAIALRDPAGTIIDIEAGGTAAAVVDLFGLRINGGWAIMRQNTGNGGDTSEATSGVLEVEKARR